MTPVGMGPQTAAEPGAGAMTMTTMAAGAAALAALELLFCPTGRRLAHRTRRYDILRSAVAIDWLCLFDKRA